MPIICSKPHYKNGKITDGPSISYHENGQVSIIGNYKDHYPDGKWVWYHENGQVQSKRDHKGGRKIGVWKYFNDNGDFTSEYDYGDGSGTECKLW